MLRLMERINQTYSDEDELRKEPFHLSDSLVNYVNKLLNLPRGSAKTDPEMGMPALNLAFGGLSDEEKLACCQIIKQVILQYDKRVVDIDLNLIPKHDVMVALSIQAKLKCFNQAQVNLRIDCLSDNTFEVCLS
jgi:predicted component of type VI protein secretion system